MSKREDIRESSELWQALANLQAAAIECSNVEDGESIYKQVCECARAEARQHLASTVCNLLGIPASVLHASKGYHRARFVLEFASAQEAMAEGGSGGVRHMAEIFLRFAENDMVAAIEGLTGSPLPAD